MTADRRRVQRPERTVSCPSCGAERTTRSYGGIPVRCLSCGQFFATPNKGSGPRPPVVATAAVAAPAHVDGGAVSPGEPRQEAAPPARPTVGTSTLGPRIVRAERTVLPRPKPAPPGPPDTSAEVLTDDVPTPVTDDASRAPVDTTREQPRSDASSPAGDDASAHVRRHTGARSHRRSTR